MHVMISAQYFWPESVGAGVWLHQLATDLVSKGHRVTMLTAFPNYPEGRVFDGYRGRLFMREEVDGVEVIRIYIHATPSKSFWPLAFSFGSFCASAMVGAILASRPDVIYCVLPPLPLGLTTELAGMFRGAPVVINIQDIYPDIAASLGYLKNGTAIRFFQRMERLIYDRAAAIVVITESFQQNLIGKGVPPEKVRVIPNWVDSSRIQPGSKWNQFRQSLEADGKFLIVYSGGMGHNTRLETLVEAAHLLASEPCQFILVGDGAHRQKLEEQACRLRLKNLRFLPFQPAEVYPQVLAASDVQLVSLNESASQMSLPSKILKIMASGRPILVLARPDSDAARLVARAQCGAVVNPADPMELATTLRQLAQKPEELIQMGQNARRFAIENFDQRKCIDQIESVLQRIVGAENLIPSAAGVNRS